MSAVSRFLIAGRLLTCGARGNRAAPLQLVAEAHGGAGTDGNAFACPGHRGQYPWEPDILAGLSLEQRWRKANSPALSGRPG